MDDDAIRAEVLALLQQDPGELFTISNPSTRG
jgi:hypothetical protein